MTIHDSGWVGETHFTAKDALVIADLLQIEEFNSLGELNTYASRYVRLKNEVMPRNSAQRKQISLLKKKVESLTVDLRNAEWIIEGYMPVIGDTLISTASEAMGMISAVCDKVFYKIPEDRGGPTYKGYRYQFHFGLINIYKKETRKEPTVSNMRASDGGYEGQLAAFIEFCHRRLDEDPEEETTLGSAIARAISIFKKMDK